MGKLDYKELANRLIDISYRKKLSHIGSCLTALPIIIEIYEKMNKMDRFVLSQGHAGLALYVVLEALGLGDAEEWLANCGIHPDRPTSMVFRDGEMQSPFHVSTGSLGHGLPISIGMGLAARDLAVYVLTSDGEMAEGSMYEALNIAADLKLDNLHIYINDNGYSAYRETNLVLHPNWKDLDIKTVITGTSSPYFLRELEGHYHVMNKEEYKEINIGQSISTISLTNDPISSLSCG